MPNPEWGTKRLCPTSGQRFYDLNKVPVVSPYTGEVVSPNVGKIRAVVADVEEPVVEDIDVEDIEAEDVLTEDAANDADIDDDLLEEDEDDSVSLDEIADVAGEDDEV